MADRVYEHFPNVKSARLREVVAAIGDSLTIAGLILGNHRDALGLLLPNAHGHGQVGEVLRPDAQEWAAILAQSDEPMVFAQDATGVLKPMVRKVQWIISQSVQQDVWARDDCACWYCGRKMGRGVTLTIDHIIPMDQGGANTPDNLVTACKKCNKHKGNMSAEKWCEKIGKSYESLVEYVAQANRERL